LREVHGDVPSCFTTHGYETQAGTEEQCLREIRKPLSDQAAGGEWDLKDVTGAIQQGATIWLTKRGN